MAFRRRAFEPGHRAKVLVIIDETPECMRAALFAARRVMRTGASIILLAIIVPDDAQPWIGVGNLMQAEAEVAANQRLDQAASLINAITEAAPERVIRTGKPADEVLKLIEQDEDIATLVLAAGAGKDGPGPLVSLVAGRIAARFPVPVTLVPGGLAEEDFEALA